MQLLLCNNAEFFEFVTHIARGCRQEDPILQYLFLTVPEILNILTKKFISYYYQCRDVQALKIMQFVDDTTLLLNGIQNSLQTALNILFF